MIELTKYNVKDSDILAGKYVGDNQKGAIIILPLDSSDSDIKLLDNILESTGFNEAKDVLKIFLKEDEQIRWSQLVNTHSVNFVFAFGYSPKKLSLNIEYKLNTLINFNKRQFIFSNLLSEFAENKELKKQLWSALKQCSIS